MSFKNIDTSNINLSTINWVPVPTGGIGSKGPIDHLNTSNGAGGWQNTTYTLSGYTLSTSDSRFELTDGVGNSVYSNNTSGVGLNSVSGFPINISGGGINIGTASFGATPLYTLPTTGPGSKYQLLSTSSYGAPSNLTFTDPRQTVYMNSTLITDATNSTLSSPYIFSTFNSTAVPVTSTDVSISNFKMINGKDYTFTITISNSPGPISAGSVVIGLATAVYADGGGGSISYVVSPIAASIFTLTSANFTGPGGYNASITFTAISGANITLPYIILSGDLVWNITKTISINTTVTQNN
jgi:hypothetical protein